MGEPIWMDCEGIGQHVHTLGWVRSGICAMCGQVVACDSYNRALHHQRDDVLARVARGDFG